MPLSAAHRLKPWLALMLGACLASCGVSEPPEPASSRPNIVLVIADDLGFGDLAHFGGPQRTPALDQLAQDGLRLEQFHAFPLCTPSRAALLTGRSPIREGLAWSPLRPWSELGLSQESHTLPEVLRAAGYRTALLGKWHLGHALANQNPRQHGFDHFYGFLTGAVDYFSHESRDGGRDWQRNGATVNESGYVTRLLSREAEELIAGHDFEQPLFLMLSYSAPHRPMQAPQETLEETANFATPAERVYAAMLVELDRGFARVQGAIEQAGQSSDTVWVFVSDNGAALQLGGSNGELKGGKSAVTQGGLRVPALVYWPGKLEGGGARAEFTSVLDLAPTIAGFAGASFPGAPDGRDLHRVWLGQDSAPQKSTPVAFVAHNDQRGQMALIDWPWKLIRRIDREGGTVREQLFHLGDDPAESYNLMRDEPATADRLRQALADWIALDPQGITLQTLPPWQGDAPSTWKAPAEWAEAVR